MRTFKMKNLLALLLTLALMFSLASVAFADGPDGPPDGTPPAGDQPGGAPPGPPPGGNPGGPGGGPGGMPPPPPGGGASAPESYDAVFSYKEDASLSDQKVDSTAKDESAVHVSGGEVNLDKLTVSRVSADSTGGELSSFYGVGAAILVTGGTVNVNGGTIDTDANGGAGVFALGDGVAHVKDCVINTKQDSSGGVHAAGAGTVYAENLTITTQGQHSAPVRSDRGGGLMVVDGGTYTANGAGSPAIYSTANIVARGKFVATGSEAACIEGRNGIYLFDSELTGDIPANEQNDCDWNVIVYQSMSGDAEDGRGTFQMVDSSLTSKNGGMFYTTNTESTFVLKNVNITPAEKNDFFLRCTGNVNGRVWGTAGKNGAKCIFSAIEQKMVGDIQWDSISTLDFYMTEGSELTGAILNDESCVGETRGSGYAKLYISEGSSWIVTDDSVLTELQSSGEVKDADGKKVTIKKADGTVLVQGDSKFSVTVDDYKDSADLSGMAKVTSWDDAQVNTGTSGGPGMPPMPGGGFTDIAPGDYCFDAALWAVDNGITQGTGDNKFSPERTCSRAEIITFLYRASDAAPKEGAENPFTDVKPENYFYDAALWAYDCGMVTGTEFQPNVDCTRASTVTYIWQSLGSPKAGKTDFTDVPADADYAQAAAWAVETGVTQGTGNNAFSPDRTCTRGEIVTLLNRALAK